MKIIYISTSCSTEKYKKVFAMRTKKAIEPQQKFNDLFIQGLAKQPKVEVLALSTLPVSASTCSIDQFEFEEEKVSESLVYQYIPFRNGKVTRLYDMCVNTEKLLKQFLDRNKNEKCAIIADVLSPFMTVGCFGIAHKYKVPIIGIVTDLPELATKMKMRKDSFVRRNILCCIEKFNTYLLKKYDAYITLTDSINEAINKEHGKKHIVVEGSVDARLNYVFSDKSASKEVVYAGGVYEKYGVKTLVEAFLKTKVSNELHIYGDGTYVDKVKEISKKHPNVKYMGMVSLEEIVEIERKATLLVNPRPSNESFSKYSFPSKTLEYMSSCTPLLSTKLPGIPPEYFKYIYTIDNEDVDGMADALLKVLSCDSSSLEENGKKAFEFVKQYKTNVVQGKRIVEFINTFYNG